MIPAEHLGAGGGVGGKESSVKAEEERLHPPGPRWVGPELPGSWIWGSLGGGGVLQEGSAGEAAGRELLGGCWESFTGIRAKEGAGASLDTRLSLRTPAGPDQGAARHAVPEGADPEGLQASPPQPASSHLHLLLHQPLLPGQCHGGPRGMNPGPFLGALQASRPPPGVWVGASISGTSPL